MTGGLGTLLRKALLLPPARMVPENEQALMAQVQELEDALRIVERQNRQQDAIYLLEQEVAAITAGQGPRQSRQG